MTGIHSTAEPTDPRSARSRRAMITAISELMAEEGAAAVTHQRVAERSGVGRATVYRHWPTPADLLYGGLAEMDEPLLRHGDGPLIPWLRRELRRVATDVGQPNAIEFLAVIVSSAPRDPAIAAMRDQIFARSIAPLADAVARAVTAGDLTDAPNTNDLLAALLGPLIFRVVMEGRVATGVFIDELIQRALAPISAI